MNDRKHLIKAKEFIDIEDYEKSLNYLLQISHNPSKKVLELKNQFLAFCYFNLNNFNYSLICCDEALTINPSNEFASLNKYIILVKQKQFNNALLEIITFLKSNPAKLYKATLKELLLEIEANNIIDEKVINVIKIIAIENNIN